MPNLKIPANVFELKSVAYYCDGVQGVTKALEVVTPGILSPLKGETHPGDELMRAKRLKSEKWF